MMFARQRTWATGLLIFVFLVTGYGSALPATAAPLAAAAAQAAQPDPAATYCTEKGGEVVTRRPTYNTNAAPSQWLYMSGSRQFCEFESTVPGDTTASRISIDLNSLYTDQPSMAVLAYLRAPRFTEQVAPGVNPAPHYCRQLGGTSVWGGIDDLSGGGWTNLQEPIFTVMDSCVFPDLSAIDQWGLLYHSNGTIRGIDLATVVRYHPPTSPAPPSIFPSGPSRGGLGAAPPPTSGGVGAEPPSQPGAVPGMPRTGAPATTFLLPLALAGLVLVGLGWAAARRHVLR